MLYSFLINVLRVTKTKLNVSVVQRGRNVGVWGWKNGERLASAGRETLGQLPSERFRTGNTKEEFPPLVLRRPFPSLKAAAEGGE